MTMEWFNDCFFDRKYIHAKEGIIEYINIFPTQLSFAEEQLPVLVACGWGESLESIKETLYELHKEGNRVIALNPAHIDHIHGVQSIFPADAYVKAIAYLEILKELSIKKVNIVAHSEGAINAMITATLKPNTFHKLILVAPAGMIENDDFVRLTTRFVRNFIHITKNGFWSNATHKSLERAYVKSVFWYFLMNPLQSLREALMLPQFDLEVLIERIDSSDLNIYLLLENKDEVFPIQQLKKPTEHVSIKKIEVLEGEHTTIHTEPQKIVPLISKILQEN